MLIDTVTIIAKAGDGGNGVATFKRDAMSARGGPDGGNGGHGGDILFRGSPNVSDLRYFRYKKTITGENGGNGTKHNGFGKNAKHIIVDVPLGTTITDMASGKVIEINSVDKPVLIVRGGHGGFGNVAYKSPTNQAPKMHQPGSPGEVKRLVLEMRLIAQAGLVGLPNAGKSSLLRAITHATPAVGAYPFTTLEPTIGMMDRYAIADIPGLIEGASRGVGLGLTFLKHIEKTVILIHCIDMAGEDPREAYETVRKEFAAYSAQLLTKPEIIFLNKADLLDPGTIRAKTSLFSDLSAVVFAGSVHNPKNMQALTRLLMKQFRRYMPKTAKNTHPQ